MYVKLFSSILDSSVWDESPETRLVWITMLLMADENGFVRGTHQAIARRAVVAPERAADAIQTLEAPDPRSHTTEHDGRRLEAVDGGWLVLNYGKYREFRTRKQVKEADKKRRQRERGKEGEGTSPVCPPVSPPYASALASGFVVSSAVAEKLTPEARSCYEAVSVNAAMDGVIGAEAVKRSWAEVSQCVVEMVAADAKWTPHVFRAFLAKIPRPTLSPLQTGPKPAAPWCVSCDGPVMRENGTGRLTPMHVEGCSNA